MLAKVAEIADQIDKLKIGAHEMITNYITENLPRVLEEYYGLKEGQEVIDQKGLKRIIRLDPSILIGDLYFTIFNLKKGEDMAHYCETRMVSHLFCDALSLGNYLSVNYIAGNEGKSIDRVLKKQISFDKEYEPRIIAIANKGQINFRPENLNNLN